MPGEQKVSKYAEGAFIGCVTEDFQSLVSGRTKSPVSVAALVLVQIRLPGFQIP